MLITWIFLHFYSKAVQASCVGYPCENTLVGHSQAVNSAVWSPDGTLVASGSTDALVKIWNASSGACLQTFPASAAIYSISWKSSRLAAACDGGRIHVWDLNNASFRMHWAAHSSSVRSVAWSPDTSRLASSADDNSVKVWEVATGACLNLVGHTKGVKSVAWSPVEAWLASGSDDNTIKIWDIANNGTCLQTLNGGAGQANAVAWNYNGSLLASGTDRTLQVWDVASGVCVRNFTGHTDWLSSVTWSPDASYVVSSSNDQLIKIFDMANGECLQTRTLTGHLNYVRSVMWHPILPRLVSASDDNTIKIWDVTPSTVTSRSIFGHQQFIQSVAWNRNGSLLLTGAEDWTVKIWDVERGTCMKTFNETSEVRAVAWSPDEQRIASGTDNPAHSITIWNVSTGEILRIFHLNETVKGLLWSFDGSRLLTASDDKTIQIWDTESGVRVSSWPTKDWVYSLAWNRNHSLLAAGDDSGLITIWDLALGSPVRNLTGHISRATSLAWSPNDALLASGSNDHTVRIWNVFTGECLMNISAHSSKVSSVVWSLDGSRLFSGGRDQTLKMWDAVTGVLEKSLSVPTWPQSLVWNFDGTRLAGADDATLKIWYPRVLNVQGKTSNNSLSLAVTGLLLDETVKVQLFRAGPTLWIDCLEIPLIGSSTNMTGFISSLQPGEYRFAVYDRFSGANSPWVNLTQSAEILCPEGTQVNSYREWNASCQACPNASVNTAGLSPCVKCLGAMDLNHTTCLPCPSNASFNADAEACACNLDYYSSELLTLECLPCPKNGKCDGTSLKAADNFWQTLDNKIKFLPCANQVACVSGNCSKGYQGYLCGQCTSGYGQYQRLCEDCETTSPVYVLVSFFVSSTLFVTFVYLSLNHKPQPLRPGISAFKIGLSAAQVNAMLPGLGLRLSSVVTTLFGLQQGIQNGAILSLSCSYFQIGLSPEDVFFATAFLWLVVPIVCVIIGVYGCYIIFRLLGYDVSLKRWFITSWCCFVFTFHAAISLQTFQMFVCRPADSSLKMWRLTADVAIECYTSRHIANMLVVGVPLLAIYVLLPPAVAFWYLCKRKIGDETPNEIQFLCSEFNPHAQWWFLVVLTRKLVIAALMAFLAYDPVIQGAVTTLALMTFAIAHATVSPYASSLKAVNVAENLSLFTSMALYLIASLVFLNPSQEDKQSGAEIVLTILMVGFYAIIGLLVGNDLIVVARRRCYGTSEAEVPFLDRRQSLNT